MTARWASPLICLIAACSAAPPPSSTQAASRPQTEEPAALLSLCQGACERRSQPRAVAAEVITRECAERCAEVPSWPWVRSGVAARQQLGRSVRLKGVLRGAQVRLSDGVQVVLRGADSLALEAGQMVVIAGQLDSEAEAGFVLHASFGMLSRATP